MGCLNVITEDDAKINWLCCIYVKLNVEMQCLKWGYILIWTRPQAGTFLGEIQCLYLLQLGCSTVWELEHSRMYWIKQGCILFCMNCLWISNVHSLPWSSPSCWSTDVTPCRQWGGLQLFQQHRESQGQGEPHFQFSWKESSFTEVWSLYACRYPLFGHCKT